MKKEYYTLTEIERYGLSNLKSRHLKRLMKKHLDSGTIGIGDHLYRIGWAWQIHHTLLPHFQGKK